MFSVLVVVLRPDHIAGLGFSSGQRIDRAANDAAGLCWRLLMTVFGPFCMTHSFPNGEICSMRHTKDENQRWWHVRHPFHGRAIQQRIRSGERSPEEMLTIFWS